MIASDSVAAFPGALGPQDLGRAIPGAQFDYSRYQPRQIGELLREQPARRGLVITVDIPIRSKVLYSGEFRELSQDARRLILAWADAMNFALISHIVLAACIAHVIALRTFPDRRLALQSQYAMPVLMVGYTAVSLWIVAQPIVVIGRQR